MPKALKITGKVIGIVLTVLIGLVLLANIYLIAAENIFDVEQPTVFGYTAKIVGSPSMHPTINVNDMVIVKACDEYGVGDVIMFDDPKLSVPVTHRIIEENPDGSFVTKGDNPENSADPNPVHPDDIYGKVIKTVGGVGGAVEFMRSPLGMIILFAVAAVLVLLTPTKSDKKSDDTEKAKSDAERENSEKEKEIAALKAELDALKAEKDQAPAETQEPAENTEPTENAENE